MAGSLELNSMFSLVHLPDVFCDSSINPFCPFFRCTVDPVLFENFLTEDGDLLRAKFQAFKFPETNFVLFKGIVNVCLDRCNGVRKTTLH